MRLYSTAGATQVDDPEFGTFKPDANGAFDGLPDPMYAKLHGRPGWENEAERASRLTAEQMEKLRDPATMLAELQKMTASQGELTSLLANAFAAAQAPAATPAAEAPAAPAVVAAPPAETATGEEPVEDCPEESGEAAEEPTADAEDQAPAESPKKAPRSPRASKKAAASSPAS